MTLSLSAALTALSLSFTLPGAALAQEATAPAEQNIEAQETPWQVNCTPTAEGAELDCSMVKSLSVNEGKQLMAQAAVVAGEPFVVRILVPHGMSLTDGLKISVDGVEWATPSFKTSLPGGVIAATDLTQDFEAALRAGNQLEIEGIQNNGAAFRLTMGLAGFSASIDKLR
jgi:invasion protein IalB